MSRFIFYSRLKYHDLKYQREIKKCLHVFCIIIIHQLDISDIFQFSILNKRRICNWKSWSKGKWKEETDGKIMVNIPTIMRGKEWRKETVWRRWIKLLLRTNTTLPDFLRGEVFTSSYKIRGRYWDIKMAR